MTDRAAIIERAARAIYAAYDPRCGCGCCSGVRADAEAALNAICTGLLDGTAWLAPWEATEAMAQEAGWLDPADDARELTIEDCRHSWGQMRDAHLSQSTQEPTP